MTITFFSIFPNYFSSVLHESILKRAQDKSLVQFETVDIRTFATDKHSMTDDRPFGGGAGMVMKIEPIHKAVTAWRKKFPEEQTWLIATSASGARFTQDTAKTIAQLDHVGILCGHYEGIDQRVLDNLVDEQIRIGDYILTGGEPAAVVIADAVTRLIPGVLGNEESSLGEAHARQGQGSVPQYTRPAVYEGWKVPQVLLDGDHAAIDAWRESNRHKIKD